MTAHSYPSQHTPHLGYQRTGEAPHRHPLLLCLQLILNPHPTVTHYLADNPDCAAVRTRKANYDCVMTLDWLLDVVAR